MTAAATTVTAVYPSTISSPPHGATGLGTLEPGAVRLDLPATGDPPGPGVAYSDPSTTRHGTGPSDAVPSWAQPVNPAAPTWDDEVAARAAAAAAEAKKKMSAMADSMSAWWSK